MWISATAHSITLTVFPIPVRFKHVSKLTAPKHGLEKTSVKPVCQERMKNNTSTLAYSLWTIRSSLSVYSMRFQHVLFGVDHEQESWTNRLNDCKPNQEWCLVFISRLSSLHDVSLWAERKENSTLLYAVCFAHYMLILTFNTLCSLQSIETKDC